MHSNLLNKQQQQRKTVETAGGGKSYNCIGDPNTTTPQQQ